MKNFNKKIALIAALACAGTMLAGCNSNTTDDGGNTGGGNAPAADGGNAGGGDSGNAGGGDAPAPAPAADLADDGDKLTILCWTGDDIDPMIDYFVANSDYTKDQVTWVQVGTSGGEAREQYQQYLSGGEDADLLILEADWILQYLNDQYTVPLSSLGIDKGDYSNAYSYTTAIGTDESGTLRAATWQCAPGGYAYRADLAEQYLGVTSPEEMQAKIGDWSKFEEAAKTVSEASGGKTAMAATLGGMWQVYQYNRSQPWVVNNKVVLDNAENFLDIAKTYRENNWVTDVGQWSDAWYAIGQDDSTMGYFFSTWCLGSGAMLSNAEGGEGGATYGKYNLCPGPSGYAWGGSWLAPSTKCNNKTMAADFVKMFTVNTDTMKGYALSKGEFVNNKAAMQAIVDEKSNSNPLLGGQDQFAVLMDSANAIKMDGLITKYDSAIKEQFNNAVTDYVDGKYATKEDALNGFQDAVAAIYPDFDWD
ncbi:MAG: carbohydrate ABC transporter substrate-binding protein [Oscillospiraceae bacterium]|nr:carbohydrate ABC transporter substrate-binding protein [Oscillospiraceae bacterium]